MTWDDQKEIAIAMGIAAERGLDTPFRILRKEFLRGTAEPELTAQTRIPWIKWHREQTGASLKDAKELCDKICFDRGIGYYGEFAGLNPNAEED